MTSLPDLFRSVVLGQTGPVARDPSAARVSAQLLSPSTWTSADTLEAIVWADVFGSDYVPTTRKTAMAVPAVARMRHLLVGIVARLPLQQLTGQTVDPPTSQPLWMQRTDGTLSPWHRMAWTVDDLLFHGWSLWAGKRGAVTDGSPLLEAARVPISDWEVNPEGLLIVKGQTVRADQAILIPGPHGGLLNDSSPIIRMAADNLLAAANAARNPNPNVNLHYTGDDPLKPEDRDELIRIWAEARRGLNGGVGFTNKWVEATVMGSHLDKLLIEGRNADAVDVARAGGIPAASIDATTTGASLEYQTATTRNQELLDYGAQLYMDAIAARLSQDDCVPRGHRTAFDVAQFTSLTPSTTGAPTSD